VRQSSSLPPARETRLAIQVTRRTFVATTVAAAVVTSLSRAARALATPPPCTLIPEQEVGPFYVADELIRSTIAEDKPGIPLALRINFIDARTCAPLPNAAIDLWHCDGLGLYSG
jgi:protocatechuate 3,4-dioxygenase beta subunit